MTSTDRASRFTYLRELPRYLIELRELLGAEVKETDLLSLEESRTIRANLQRVSRTPASRSRLDFGDKSSQRFRALIERLTALNPSDLYVWMPASNACGLIRIGPLPTLNWDFSFEVNPEGIVTVFTVDSLDEMVLDFSLEDGRKELELDLRGVHWGECSY